MDKPVSYKLAHLLKKKGFDEPCRASILFMSAPFYNGGLTTNSELSKQGRMMGISTLCSAPTIAEVIMWLYEKHGIWISVELNTYDNKFDYLIITRKIDSWHVKDNDTKKFNLPTEAYEAAIKYCLEKCI